MARQISLLLIVLLLVGCTTKEIVRIEYVKVPPKEPPVIVRPALETEYLKAENDSGMVLQAHRITIKRLQQWGLELEAALDAYRTKKETK